MLQDGQEILEGRFQIIKKLGSGAFGEIYKGKFRLICLEEGAKRRAGSVASWYALTLLFKTNSS